MYTNGSHHKETLGKGDTKAPQPLHNPANPAMPVPVAEDGKDGIATEAKVSK